MDQHSNRIDRVKDENDDSHRTVRGFRCNFQSLSHQGNRNTRRIPAWDAQRQCNRKPVSRNPDWLHTELTHGPGRMENSAGNRISWKPDHFFDFRRGNSEAHGSPTMENSGLIPAGTAHDRTFLRFFWASPRKTFELKGEQKKKSTPKGTTRESQSPEEESKDPAMYRCKACNNPVAVVGDEIKIGEIPTLTAQVNPHGFVHEVLTLNKARNVILHGHPTPADSWFPGYQWRYCICASCHTHLGWSYHKPMTLEVSFVGLRRIVIIQDEG